MKIFESFPKNSKCPICGTNKKGKWALIGIQGTERDSLIKCMPVHLDCLDFRVMNLDNKKVIYMQFFPKKKI